MSKTKSTTKATKSSKSDVLAKVKDTGVTKPSKDVKSKSKDNALKDEKKSKKSKKVKEPTPEPSSSEEEEEVVSSESDSSDSEPETKVQTKKPVVNAKVNGSKKVAAKEDSSDASASSDSDAGESSEDEAPLPKKGAEKKTAVKANGAKSSAKKEESSDESESSDDDDENVPATGVLGAAPAVDEAGVSDDESDSSEEEGDKKKANSVKGATAAGSDEDSEDSSDESSEDEEAPKPAAKANKRKAEELPERAQKKAKAEAADASGGSKNLFVGNLSWNVDDNMLRETFEEHGEITGVRIMYDRATGRAKGFGYVEFANAADAAAAHEAKKGFELDGRAMNVDYSNPKPDNREKVDDRRKSYGDQLSEPSDTLFVGNISFDVGQEQVSEAFAPCGTIMSVRLPTDQTTGTPKGFGYVTFSSVEEAQAGLDSMQGAYIGSRPIRLDFSQPRPERSEGGFGGGGRGRGGDRGRGFGGRGRGGDRGRGGFGGGRGRGGDRGRGGFGGRGRGASTNRGGFGDFSGTKVSFD